jgi:iron complex transport system ATP-binding protein
MSDSFSEGAALFEPIGSSGIVSLANVTYRYNGSRQPVLENLSLDIPAGTATAILGPNGSGKTTLLRLLVGVLRSQEGEIRFAGWPQGSYSRREMGQLIGLVPQDEHIPFDFSILEYVLLGRAPYLRSLATPTEADHQVAREVLHTAGLEGLQDRPLPKLSGGERQLAVVARALAQQPRILLMDEPAAHLDLSNQGRLLSIMRNLVAGGTTLILTTHDPNLAAAVASFAVLMRDGRILAAGQAGSILTSEKLSATYGAPVEVFQIDGRRIILLS